MKLRGLVTPKTFFTRHNRLTLRKASVRGVPAFMAMFLLGAVAPARAQKDRLRTQPRRVEQKQTIVVTGVYKPVPLMEADRSITVINLDRQQLLGSALVDFLAEDASVDLQERGPDGTQADVSIRGGTFEQTLILLDGWRMNDVQSAHHDMDLPITMQAVSSIQILHGSGTTLYGSDAVGGVVNFVTREPRATEMFLQAAAGNFGINQEAGTFSIAQPNFGEELDFSRDFSTGFLPDRDYRDLALDSITYGHTSLGATQILLAHNDRPFGANQFYGNFNSWERTRTWFAGIRQAVGRRNEVSFAFRRHTDFFVLYRNRPWVYANHHADRSYQAAWRHHQRLSMNTQLYVGLEGFRDSIRSNNLGEHLRNRAAGYAALDVRPWRRFSFTLGAREETYGSLHGEFCPSISGGYWIDSRLQWRAAVERAFQLPTFTDLYYHDPATLGNPNLKPQRAWNYETGFDWYPRARWAAHITLFERQDRDGIDYARTPGSAVWRAMNIDNLTFQGVELAVGTRLHRSQQIQFSYTALHGSRAPARILQSRYLFNYLVNSAEMTWLGTLPGGLIARSRFGVLQRIHQSPYALWDMAVARSLGRLRPYLQVSNLTNTFYEEIPNVPMPGRTVVVGLRIRIFGRRTGDLSSNLMSP